MTTSADRSRVLSVPPTATGSVIGRSYEAFGATIYGAGVLAPDGTWWHTGRGSGGDTSDEQAVDLTLDDWLLIGAAPDALAAAEPLITLPTEPGSVIARKHRTQGIRIAVLNPNFDVATDEPDGHFWQRSGMDSFPSLSQSAKWLTKHRWVLVGVVPPGTSERTEAQLLARQELLGADT